MISRCNLQNVVYRFESLKNISYDKANEFYMIENDNEFTYENDSHLDFDFVQQKNMGECFKSVDLIMEVYKENNNTDRKYIFVEFKNGNFSSNEQKSNKQKSRKQKLKEQKFKNEIRNKIKDSILFMSIFTQKSVYDIRENSQYIVVYNKSKNSIKALEDEMNRFILDAYNKKLYKHSSFVDIEKFKKTYNHLKTT